MTQLAFFATAPRNLESLLADELRAVGLGGIAETRGGARFSGSLSDAYRACLWSRVANRILLPLSRFPAESPEALYAGATAIPWEQHLLLERTFAVQLDSSRSNITHSRYGALKVKDAIVDRFRARTGARPNVDTDSPDLRINVYLHQNEAVVSLDLSGASLHMRGYRQLGTAAPMKENLAAAILLRAGWDEIAAGSGSLLDPLCGSGTLCIEGAWIAADIAPGLLRKRWGFEGWRGHDADAWAGLVAEARERRSIGSTRLGCIRGYDRNPSVVRVALDAIARAGLAGRVHVERRDLRDCAPAKPSDRGLVVANPPYGQRMGEGAELPALYAQLGKVLRERFLGWRAAVFTGNPDLGKNMGLRAKRYHSLYNGALECRLLHFDIETDAFVSDRPRPLPSADRSPGARMLANRLMKNRRTLEKWCRREQIHCYRLYDADLPEYAFAVDIYGGDELFVHVQEYEPPASVDPKRARRRVREALGVIAEVLEVPEPCVFFKVRRRQKGNSQYQRLSESGDFHEIRESGLRFLVNLEDYIDTGLFLDHRGIRRFIGELAKGRHFLNLFAYTGTASVYAAHGGALTTTSVDMSATYLDWAKRNLSLNGFRGTDHRLIQADCLRWLRQETAGRRFGIIFVDPPSYSTSKRMSRAFDVQRDHVELIRDSAKLLEPGGSLIFSNNLRRFRLDEGALDGLEIKDITARTMPRDFARNPGIHHCWHMRIRGPGD